MFFQFQFFLAVFIGNQFIGSLSGNLYINKYDGDDDDDDKRHFESRKSKVKVTSPHSAVTQDICIQTGTVVFERDENVAATDKLHTHVENLRSQKVKGHGLEVNTAQPIADDLQM